MANVTTTGSDLVHKAGDGLMVTLNMWIQSIGRKTKQHYMMSWEQQLVALDVWANLCRIRCQKTVTKAHFCFICWVTHWHFQEIFLLGSTRVNNNNKNIISSLGCCTHIFSGSFWFQMGLSPMKLHIIGICKWLVLWLYFPEQRRWQKELESVVVSVYVWAYSSTISVCHDIRSVLHSNQIEMEGNRRGRHAALFTNQICVLSKWATSLAVDTPDQSDMHTEATVNPIHPKILKSQHIHTLNVWCTVLLLPFISTQS